MSNKAFLIEGTYFIAIPSGHLSTETAWRFDWNPCCGIIFLKYTLFFLNITIVYACVKGPNFMDLLIIFGPTVSNYSFVTFCQGISKGFYTNLYNVTVKSLQLANWEPDFLVFWLQNIFSSVFRGFLPRFVLNKSIKRRQFITWFGWQDVFLLLALFYC